MKTLHLSKPVSVFQVRPAHGIRPGHAGSSGLGAPGVPAWPTSYRLGLGLAIFALAALRGSLEAQSAVSCLSTSALVVDASPTGTSDGNGVLEPGETVGVTPSWKFAHRTLSSPSPCGAGSLETFWGTALTLTGPPAEDYVIDDDRANYLPENCSSLRSDCYSMSVSESTGRPASHWDATLRESVLARYSIRVSFSQWQSYSKSATKDWTLHIGDSFADVPRSQPFYKKIETLLHNGITSGCSPTQYCPGQKISRGQIATFTAKGLAGSAANIPASGTIGSRAYDCSAGGVSLFTDVDPSDMFCKQIHFIVSKNVDPGCDPGLYCPGDTLTRLQMAAFVANALVQPGGDAAVPLTYGPDPITRLSYSCDPASPNSHFTDVPDSDPLRKDANYLWARGIISGCSATEYCPTGEVTRDQMAKFLVNAFKLTFYGP
jgi:hypothetical protein